MDLNSLQGQFEIVMIVNNGNFKKDLNIWLSLDFPNK